MTDKDVARKIKSERQTKADRPPDHQLLGNRYRLLDLLGSGGMGAVYRAYDRLTGETVALKQMRTSSPEWSASLGETKIRLALAQEFQALAALRHPHIIAVRDYGFDAEQQPYLTMDLLPEVQTILEAGHGQPTAFKLTLLWQFLYALAYLHRHSIVHRDLKPGNVLVVEGTLKVLDFGLAALAGQVTDIAGTLGYIAPEVLMGEPAGVEADLYAVGVMAYELFTGQHPFQDAPGDMVNAVFNQEPDWSRDGLPPGLGVVLASLLAKRPAERYSDVGELMTALSEVVTNPLPAETTVTRESFLQAARFVGREVELGHLLAALSETQAGQGRAWLVGGESGVGKSRLLAELRTQALVQGTPTLRGQAVSEGGQPYHLWRAIARWLALMTEPDDLQAGVLKTLVPDLAALLKREVPDAPPLEAQEAETRLLAVMIDLFRQASASWPLLLLLEDLHWADANSLTQLTRLIRNLTDMSLLVVAAYRDDEAPDLPKQLPVMQRSFLENVAAHREIAAEWIKYREANR